MPKAARDVRGALAKKGFEDRQGDDVFYHLHVDGKKTKIWTKISHGAKEIHDRLLGAMARQLRLTGGQFRELVECPMSESDYIALLRDQGDIE